MFRTSLFWHLSDIDDFIFRDVYCRPVTRNPAWHLLGQEEVRRGREKAERVKKREEEGRKEKRREERRKNGRILGEREGGRERGGKKGRMEEGRRGKRKGRRKLGEIKLRGKSLRHRQADW